MLKACLDCQQIKELDAFPRNKGRSDGRGSYCRDCYAVRSRASYAQRRAAVGQAVRLSRDVPAGHSWCAACQQAKPFVDFPNNRSAWSGRGNYCKPCHNAKTKATCKRLYGGTRNYHLRRRRYGITAAEYDELVASQGGHCALCRERPPKHVDHDHLTGRVRGALCSGCNQGLGNFRDGVDAVRAAADYLKRTTVQRSSVAPGVVRLTWPAEPRQAPIGDLAPLLARRWEQPDA